MVNYYRITQSQNYYNYKLEVVNNLHKKSRSDI